MVALSMGSGESGHTAGRGCGVIATFCNGIGITADITFTGDDVYFSGVFGSGDSSDGTGDTPNNSMYLTASRSSVVGESIESTSPGLVFFVDGPGIGDAFLTLGGGVNQPGNRSPKYVKVAGDTHNFGVTGLSGVDILSTVHL